MSAAAESVQQEIFPNILAPSYIKQNICHFINLRITQATFLCFEHPGVAKLTLWDDPATKRTEKTIETMFGEKGGKILDSLKLLKIFAPEQEAKWRKYYNGLFRQLMEAQAGAIDLKEGNELEKSLLEELEPVFKAYESWYKEHGKGIFDELVEFAFNRMGKLASKGQKPAGSDSAPASTSASASSGQGDSKSSAESGSSNEVPPPPVILSGNSNKVPAGSAAPAAKKKDQERELPDAADVPDAAPVPGAAASSAASCGR